jgi:two-component system NtrC family sensor kinase
MELGIFTEHHIRLAEELAGHAALAIQNAQLFQAEQAQAEKFQQAQSLLFQLEKAGALGRLTTTIAHEINNPIQAIQGCLTLTREELDGRGTKELIDRYLDVIEVEASRITTLINRMRHTHPEADDQSHQPCDINTLLDSILHQSEKQLDQKQITLQRKWAGNLPLIQANKDNLTQAFHNIIMNALEAMNDKDRLTVETSLTDLPPGRRRSAIRIIIHNSGRPIPDHIKEHLFEPFITTKEQQFGLGLFVTHSIIEAHGGQITASSTAGQGTTFTIHLPAASSLTTQSTDN